MSIFLREILEQLACDGLSTAAASLLCFDICYRNSHAIITHHLSDAPSPSDSVVRECQVSEILC